MKHIDLITGMEITPPESLTDITTGSNNVMLGYYAGTEIENGKDWTGFTLAVDNSEPESPWKRIRRVVKAVATVRWWWQ